MTEIAHIITMLVTLVGALAGLLLMASKLTPLVKEIGKLFKDFAKFIEAQHKRKTDVEKRTSIQNNEPMSETPLDLNRPPKPSQRIALIIMAVNYLCIVVQGFTSGPVTPMMLVTCSFGIMTIILMQTSIFVDQILWVADTWGYCYPKVEVIKSSTQSKATTQRYKRKAPCNRPKRRAVPPVKRR